MHAFGNFVVEFPKKEDSPTKVEYAVMLSLIIVICLVAITALSTSASKTFNNVVITLGASSYYLYSYCVASRLEARTASSSIAVVASPGPSAS
jgi:pilus assembly protein Flp/PilA